MAEFDLIPKFGPYMDSHFVFGLLEFCSNRDVYNHREMLLGKLELLKHTKMVDFERETFIELFPAKTVPEELMKRRETVLKELAEQNELNQPTIDLLNDKEVILLFQGSMSSSEVQQILQTKYGLQQEMVDRLFVNSKLMYEIGDYARAGSLLEMFILLANPQDKRLLSALWGRLATLILTQEWDKALDAFNKLRETIDGNAFGSALASLQQRAWLIHWSLFIFFNHQQGKEPLIETFLKKPQYLNAIQTLCPHILRYLTAAIILSKKRQLFDSVIEVIQQEAYKYSDPITEFMQCLYVKFDFNRAQQILRDCSIVIKNDFFLTACLDDFMENARHLIFDTFCRIHQCISVTMLSKKLNMSESEAEQWMVNMLRSNDELGAKIDSKLGHVVMGAQAVSPHEQVMHKTEGLSFKSQAMCMRVEQKLNDKARTAALTNPTTPAGDWAPSYAH